MTDWQEVGEAFKRWESSGFPNVRTWLTESRSGDKVRSYGSGLARFGSKMEKPVTLAEEAQSAKTLEELARLDKEANSIRFASGQDYAKGKINSKIADFEKKAEQLKSKEEKAAQKEIEKAEKEAIKKAEQEEAQRVRLENQVSKTAGDINSSRTLSDINRISNRLDRLEDEGANVDNARASLNDRLAEIEAERERELEQQRIAQEQARAQREESRRRGIEPSI